MVSCWGGRLGRRFCPKLKFYMVVQHLGSGGVVKMRSMPRVSKPSGLALWGGSVFGVSGSDGRPMQM